MSFELNVTISLYFVALFQCYVLASVASLKLDISLWSSAILLIAEHASWTRVCTHSNPFPCKQQLQEEGRALSHEEDRAQLQERAPVKSAKGNLKMYDAYSR